MARQQYYADPSVKHIEVFSDFRAGLNSVTSNDNMADSELPELVNADLGSRGSITRRRGCVLSLGIPVNGKAQGYFRFNKSGGGYDDIQCVAGKIYVNGTQRVTGLQATRDMEAVQFGAILYIATGSGLYQYDGTTVAAVTAYKPKPLEALYVGTNGLAADPQNYIQDGTSSVIQMAGVTFDKRYGVTNELMTVTAYATYPVGQVMEYKFERRLTSWPADRWLLGQDWNTKKTYTFYTEWQGDVEFRVSVRKQGDTAAADYYGVPRYVIKPKADPKDQAFPTSTIGQCNRILLHWNRIILYGDPNQHDLVYISDLNNPAYFPTPNTLQFENPKREGLTALVRFRDIIVAFTPSSIQALYGTNPSDYERVRLNTAIGCIAPKTAKVFGNYIGFLSYEGVQVLKSVGTTESRVNVGPLDDNVKDEVKLDVNAIAEVADNQYHIVFPSDNKRLRYYYDMGVWTKDISTKFNFNNLIVYNGLLYAQEALTGRVLVFDGTSLTDDGHAYSFTMETKYLDFGQPHNKKKIRELQLRTAPVTSNTSVTVDVYVDSTAAASQTVTIVPSATLPINEPISTFIETKATGKGRKVKLVIKTTAAKDIHILGFAFIFKLKKP